MDNGEVLLSAMVDQAIVSELVPWACPCDFGVGGRYRLEELIGAGSLGLVYRATDRNLSSEGFRAQVAVKILRHAPAGRSEALAARRVSHPCVLAIMDRDELPDGTAYVVSELVEGGDLSELRPPLGAAKAVELVAKIASGVQAAHSAGVVHCDIKPANILLTSSGEPKLSDFGLSRWNVDEPGPSRGNTAFMSPEQHAGEDNGLTPPSDIYALGGLLYYLLTGKLPHGATPEEVSRFHAEGRSVPAPGINRDLDLICQRATSRDRDRRHHSAGELADDLGRWLRREPIVWTRPPAARRMGLWARRRPTRALGIIAAVTLLAVFLGGWRYNAARDRARTLEAQAEAVKLANERVEETKARVRRHIEMFVARWFGAPGDDPNENLLPPLVWIEWIGNSPLLTADGSIPAVEERCTMLRAYIAGTAALGEGRLDTLLGKFALAQLLLSASETTESGGLIRDLEQQLAPMLGKDDPLRFAIEAFSVCHAYLAANGPSLAVAETALKTIEQKLDAGPGNESLRRLLNRVRAGRATRNQVPTGAPV